MGHLSICLYFFTMVATAFLPDLFLPAFADICANMTSVSILMNYSVSSVDSCSIINNCFLKFYVLPSKYITNRYIPALAFSLLGILSAIFNTSSSLSYGNISMTSLMSCTNIATYVNISASYSSLIHVTHFSSFTISTSVVYIRDYYYLLLSVSLLSDSSDISKLSCESSSMSSSS